MYNHPPIIEKDEVPYPPAATVNATLPPASAADISITIEENQVPRPPAATVNAAPPPASAADISTTPLRMHSDLPPTQETQRSHPPAASVRAPAAAADPSSAVSEASESARTMYSIGEPPRRMLRARPVVIIRAVQVIVCTIVGIVVFEVLAAVTNGFSTSGKR